MHSSERVEYDAIIREAEALRAQTIAHYARALGAFFRRKRAVKPLLG